MLHEVNDLKNKINLLTEMFFGLSEMSIVTFKIDRYYL